MADLTDTLIASNAHEQAKQRRLATTCTVNLQPKQDYSDALRAALIDHTWRVDNTLVTQLETIEVIADAKQAEATIVSRTELIELGEPPMACGDFRLRLLTDIGMKDGSFLTTYEVEHA